MLSQTLPLSNILVYHDLNSQNPFEALPKQSFRQSLLQQISLGDNSQKNKRSSRTQERPSLLNTPTSFQSQLKTETLPRIDQFSRFRNETQTNSSKSPSSTNRKHYNGNSSASKRTETFTQNVNRKHKYSINTQQSNYSQNQRKSKSSSNRFNKTPRNIDSRANQSIYIDESNKIDQGNFGVVYKAEFKDTKEEVAVKRVLQDKNYKNRELQIMQDIDNHPNIVQLRYSFYSFGEQVITI